MFVTNENKLIVDKKLAIITWVDSSSMSTWTSIDDIRSKKLHKNMKSVGWITNEDDELVAISSNAGCGYFSHTTFIPKVNITDIFYPNKEEK